MFKNRTFIKTVNYFGINEIQFYVLWFIFFLLVSLLFGYCYFLIYSFVKLIIVTTPLIYFFMVVANRAKKDAFKSTVLISSVFFLQSGLLTYGATLIFTVKSTEPDPIMFYGGPLLFFAGWLLNAKSTLQFCQRRLGKEWWLDITLEGITGSSGSPHDIHVGDLGIDSMLLIFGEPRTWWETQLKEPESRGFLRRLKDNGDILSLTCTDLHCPNADVKPQAEKWHQWLKDHAPSPQDWKNSGFGFSVSAKDKATAASHPGSPIAIPSLTDVKEE